MQTQPFHSINILYLNFKVYQRVRCFLKIHPRVIPRLLHAEQNRCDNLFMSRHTHGPGAPASYTDGLAQ